MKILMAEDDKTFIYELNAKGSNRWWFKVQAGFDDDGNRTSNEECEYVAAILAASPDLLIAAKLAATILAEHLVHPDRQWALSRLLVAIAKAEGDKP